MPDDPRPLLKWPEFEKAATQFDPIGEVCSALDPVELQRRGVVLASPSHFQVALLWAVDHDAPFAALIIKVYDDGPPHYWLEVCQRHRGKLEVVADMPVWDIHQLMPSIRGLWTIHKDRTCYGRMFSRPRKPKQ